MDHTHCVAWSMEVGTGELRSPCHTQGWQGSPHSHDSQAGRAATEAVTRLLMPRVLRVPRRRPQVKARNWGRGAQVTVGKGEANTQDQGQDGLRASQWGQPLGLGKGLPWGGGGGWVSRRSELGVCPSIPYLGCFLQILQA